MRPLHHPRADELSLAAVLHALADPARLAIVRRLAEGGAQSCAGSCAMAELPRATLSRHFDVLRGAGLVHTRRLGAQYENRLRTDDLQARFPGLLASILKAQALDQPAPAPRPRRRAPRRKLVQR